MERVHVLRGVGMHCHHLVLRFYSLIYTKSKKSLNFNIEMVQNKLEPSAASFMDLLTYLCFYLLAVPLPVASAGVCRKATSPMSLM